MLEIKSERMLEIPKIMVIGVGGGGNNVNIIWGTVTRPDQDTDKIVVTLIATGMSKAAKVPTVKLKPLPNEIKHYEVKQSVVRNNIEIVVPSFLRDVAVKTEKSGKK